MLWYHVHEDVQVFEFISAQCVKNWYGKSASHFWHAWLHSLNEFINRNLCFRELRTISFIVVPESTMGPRTTSSKPICWVSRDLRSHLDWLSQFCALYQRWSKDCWKWALWESCDETCPWLVSLWWAGSSLGTFIEAGVSSSGRCSGSGWTRRIVECGQPKRIIFWGVTAKAEATEDWAVPSRKKPKFILIWTLCQERQSTVKDSSVQQSLYLATRGSVQVRSYLKLCFSWR